MDHPDEPNHGASSPRRGIYLALGVAVTAGVAGAAVYSLGEDKPACDTDAISAVWSPEVERKLTVAFAGTGVPMAGTTGPRVAAVLGTYGQQWSQARVEACGAGDPGSAEVQLRMACLDEKRARFASLLDVFSDADRVVVESAMDAAWELPALEPCAMPQVALADPGEAVRVSVENLREDIHRARALTWVSKGSEALPLATEAVSRAEELGYPPVVWEALTVQASAAAAMGDVALARTAAKRAHGAALGNEQNAALEAVLIAAMLRPDPQNVPETLEFADTAEAFAALVGRTDELKPVVLRSRGRAHQVAGRLDEAKLQFDAALESADTPQTRATALRSQARVTRSGDATEQLPLRQKVVTEVGYAYGEEHWRVAEAKEELALAYLDAALPEQAIMLLDDAIKSYERMLGADSHRLVGAYRKLAKVSAATGDLEGALTLYQSALELSDRAEGVDPAIRVGVLHELAGQLSKHGEKERALATHEQAVAAAQENLPAESGVAANARLGLARALLGEGRRPEAIQELGLAVAVLSSGAGPETPELVLSALNLANLRVEEGQPAEALEALTTAAEIAKRIHAEEHLQHAYIEHVRGTVHASSKDYGAATQAFEACIEIAKRVSQPENSVNLNCRFELAQARHSAGEDPGTALTEALEMVGGEAKVAPSMQARVLILAAEVQPSKARARLDAAKAVLAEMDENDPRVEELFAKIAKIAG